MFDDRVVIVVLIKEPLIITIIVGIGFPFLEHYIPVTMMEELSCLQVRLEMELNVMRTKECSIQVCLGVFAFIITL